MSLAEKTGSKNLAPAKASATRGREVVAFFVRARLGLPATQIAAALGVSQPAIVKAADRGRRRSQDELRWEPSLE